MAVVGYREAVPPAPLRDLAECRWVLDGPDAPVRVLPDGCMDLIRMNGRTIVAGPDMTATVSVREGETFSGIRFRPGVLPRLLGVPASEVTDRRVPLADLLRVPRHSSLADLALRLAKERPRSETAPWRLTELAGVTARLAAGAAVSDVASDVGWSPRTLQRHCAAVYGYGPAMLRRILRFRRATGLLRDGVPIADVAVRAGYADQPHLHREIRLFAAVAPASLRHGADGANRSTQLPSGSATVA